MKNTVYLRQLAKNAAITLLVCVHFAFPLKAQQSIITSVTTDVNQLTQEQSIRYNKLIALNAHANYQFIHIEPLATLQQNGRLALSFDHAPCTTTLFRADEVEYHGSDSDYYWYGNLIYEDSAQECEYGTCMLLARRGEHFGQVQIRNRTYEITDLSGGLQVIAEEKMNTLEGAACGSISTAKTTTETGEPNPYAFCRVRVLVLYTRSAKQEDPNIVNRIDLALNQTRQALINSMVYPGYLDLVHAGNQEIEYSESEHSVDTDAYNMTSYDSYYTNGNAVEIVKFKTYYQADIVVMLTKPTIGGVKGRSVGIQERDSPYAAVQLLWATNSSYTFAHEVGHLLGARHQEAEGFGRDDEWSNAHAHKFTFNTETGFWPFKKTHINTQRTLTYGDTKDNGEAVLYYSSPVIDYRGTPTGIYSSPSGARNAAQHIREAGCTVAGNFAQEPGDFSVATTYEGKCPGKISVIRAHVTGPAYYPPAGGYTYQWEQSTDGVNYGPVIGTTPNLNFTMPGENDKLFFRVKVTQPGGAVQYSYRSTRPMSPPMCTGRFAPEDNNETGHSDAMSISPVPADAYTNIQFGLEQASHVDIALYDCSGRKIKMLYSGDREKGAQKIKTDLSNIVSGLYYVQFQSNDYTDTQKLLVNH